MIDNTTFPENISVDQTNLTRKNMECFICDSNGNDQEHLNFDMEFLRSSEDLVRDPDSLSMISDYSEMGLQIKQSIQFNDMIMSTYSDLKVIYLNVVLDNLQLFIKIILKLIEKFSCSL